MIQMNITSAGEAAITRNENITFTKFIAGSGNDDTYTGCVEPQQEVPIGFSQTYIAGETYNINGEDVVVTTNSVRNVGVLINQNASSPYQWKELALMAREGAGVSEFAFAYGYVLIPWVEINPAAAPISYSIPFDVVFTSSPSATATVTEMGVGWIDFLEHTQSKISDSGAHGVRLQGGDLWINGVPADLMKRELFKQGIGVSSFVSSLPLPQISLLGNLYCIVPDNTFHRLRQTEVILEGQYIYQDSVTLIWHVGDGTHPNSLLVVSDEVETPQPTEIHLTDAQNHFLTWDWVSSVDARLRVIETPNTSAFLTHTTEDGSYNKEWIDRMTGAGTDASPYLIYTPKDFDNIRNNVTASYRLMNNIDFSEAIGIPVSLNGESIIYGEVNENAPLYNAGMGFTPIGNTTTKFKGKIYGNGKVIRGITISRGDMEDLGIFGVVEGGYYQNIILKDNFIIQSSAAWEATVGCLIGKISNNAPSIYGIINYSTSVNSSSTTNFKYVAGIIGYCSVTNSTFEMCANHGKVICYNYTGAKKSGIVGKGSAEFTFKNCCNTANMICDTCNGLVSGGYGAATNCYNSGILSKYMAALSINNICEANYCTFTNCYSLSGTDATVQGVAKTSSEMKELSFVNALNTGLAEAVWAQDDTLLIGGYPILIFEKLRLSGIPLQTSIALLNPDSNGAYSSYFTFEMLLSLATKLNLQEVIDIVPKRYDLVLTSAGWNSGVQTLNIAGLLTTNKVSVIPSRFKVFTNADISYTIQEGSIKFTAVTTPTANINLTALIWKGV